MLHYKFPESERRLYTGDLILINRPGHPFNSFFTIFSISNQFGDQWIIINGYLHPLFKSIVYPHTRSFRCLISLKCPDIRKEIIFRILGINANFYSMSDYLQIVLFKT